MKMREIINIVEAMNPKLNDAFWAWFGDSKVAHASGKPMVVYHGTPTAGFDVFSDSKRGTRTNHNSADVGYHFTSDPEVAFTYSGAHSIDAYNAFEKRFGHPPAAYDLPPSPATYPVYLSIQNPKYLKGIPIDAEIINTAKNAGHDGIITPYEYVVFSATQIKSAIGNSGSFNPSQSIVEDNSSQKLNSHHTRKTAR